MPKHTIGALLLLIVCCTTGAHAHLRLCPGEFGAEGEWIYFLPSVDHPFFAAEGSQILVPNSNLTVINTRSNLLENPFEFSSGYRVGGGFAFCDCDLGVHVMWTHLRTGNKETSSGDPALVSLSNRISRQGLTNSQVETNTHFTFDSLEGSFATSLCPCSPIGLMLRMGLEYVVNEVRQEVVFSGLNPSNFITSISDRIQKKSKLWGVGPKVGLDLAYMLGCGFSVIGKAETALLISRVEATRRDLVSTTSQLLFTPTTIRNVQVGTDKIWRLVPEARLRLGLAFDLCVCNFALSAEAGYELLSYINALPYFADRDSILTVTDYSNIDLHGLYVNFSLKY